MLGLHWRVTAVSVCPQFGQGSQMGAATDVGFSAGEVRQMVGESKESRLQIAAFVSGRRFQAWREHILGQRLDVTPSDAIVWRNTRKIGCARIVCDDGDVFMTCNYDPPGNYVGEKPY
ncbi:hypothetical protein JRO89_XS06G0150700 [Xanthoceras sorbifolium]|uniref:SCP domain-containing protein n=1 Tax=Xanthoceras sorbifolium TaxID=99658 RepID=A0ABQ8HYC9_9ROSI|nr:hypothetical protein JRO89_XS06G0150700 [Xanthoceras sorbifolium]